MHKLILLETEIYLQKKEKKFWKTVFCYIRLRLVIKLVKVYESHQSLQFLWRTWVLGGCGWYGRNPSIAGKAVKVEKRNTRAKNRTLDDEENEKEKHPCQASKPRPGVACTNEQMNPIFMHKLPQRSPYNPKLLLTRGFRLVHRVSLAGDSNHRICLADCSISYNIMWN